MKVTDPNMTKVTKTLTRAAPRAGDAELAAMGARERNKLDKRARIADAAWTLFSTAGFEETSTSAVAERAGVAKGTLFLYASDKDDLLMLVMHDRLAAAMDRGFATMPARGLLVPRALHAFRALYEMYAAQPRGLGAHFVRLAATAKGPNADRVGALTQAMLSQLASLVRAAQERGEVSPDVAPTLAALNFFAAYFMGLFGWIAGLTTDVDALCAGLEAQLALQVRGLEPRTHKK
jgi:AcrR family transcriptional regulator